MKIEDDVWIGANCFIMKGVTIGKGSIVGAGSVVISEVKPFSIYAGNPAVFVKAIDEE
ncbi:MAG: DapH/DapD/GlmU-related protein [Ignavibacteria bacterium]